MGWFDGRGTAEALEDLLVREKALILGGDLDGVHRLAHEKDRLLKRLARTPMKGEGLEKLKSLADRNNELLAASARGFRHVHAQLAALSRQDVQLKTYGRDGRSSDLGSVNRDFNKRA